MCTLCNRLETARPRPGRLSGARDNILASRRMSIVVADRLGKVYGDQEVFSQATFRIEWGDRIGLVGPNGSGKSSLLRIIAACDELYEGALTRRRDLKTGLLAQEPQGSDRRAARELLQTALADVRAAEADLERLAAAIAASGDEPARHRLIARYDRRQADFERLGGYEAPRRLEETLRRLRLPEASWDAPVASLSGGQRTRLHLGFLILSRPQLLLLDEPTNYLDAASLPWLRKALAAWPGSVVTVSHDPAFLEQVTNRIWEMKHQRLTCYNGTFRQYQVQSAARQEGQAKAYQRQQAYVAKTEDFVRRFKAGQRSKEARGRETRLKRYLAAQAVARPRQDKSIRLAFPANIRSGAIVARTGGLAAGYDPARPVIVVPELEIRRLARVALLGPNGAGKSTLLRTLMGQLPPLSGNMALGANVRVGYFAQHQVKDDFAALDARQSPFDVILDQKKMRDQEVRDHLALFQLQGEDAFRPVATLSGGQKSRLAFAKLALEETNFLVLDEPLSHFDSAAALQEALRLYGGTILFVTHDPALVEALATELWLVQASADGKPSALVRRKETGRAYAQRAQADGRVLDLRPFRDRTGPAVPAAPAVPARDRTASQRQAKEQALEADITALERKAALVQERLTQASQAGDVQAIRKLSKTYGYLQEQAERRWDEWARLQEE